MRAATSCASTVRMNASPSPVPETAQSSSAYVPAPMRGEAPTQRSQPRARREVRRWRHAHAMLAREALGTTPDEQDMAALLHHRARGEHRIADAAHRADRARASRRAVHDRGVELVLLVRVVAGAAAGVEERVIIELDHGSADCTPRGATFY